MSVTVRNKIVVFHKLNLMVVLISTFYHGGMESHKQTTKLLNEHIVPVIIKLKKTNLVLKLKPEASSNSKIPSSRVVEIIAPKVKIYSKNPKDITNTNTVFVINFVCRSN